MMDQLLREKPPGFGGIERVCHGLAEFLGGRVYSLKSSRKCLPEPLPVNYLRVQLISFSIGRFIVPLPTYSFIRFLFSERPFIAHLPCPTVFSMALIARLLRPRRPIYIYWHSFISPRPGLIGFLENIYQIIALTFVRLFPLITSSPVMVKALLEVGVSRSQIACLPLSLQPEQETSYELVFNKRFNSLSSKNYSPSGRIIAIGRLDSYKRVDWLLETFFKCSGAKRLDLVGDGPDRFRLESLAERLALKENGKEVFFHGRVSEEFKTDLLSSSDILVLASDRCNEAFGIVQLEAMACGIPVLSFDLPRSGMHWVSKVEGLRWSGKPDDLKLVLERLLSNTKLYIKVSYQLRSRYKRLFSVQIWRTRLKKLQAFHE